MITKLRKHMDVVDTNLELMTIALDSQHPIQYLLAMALQIPTATQPTTAN
jgi:hypothetical protein